MRKYSTIKEYFIIFGLIDGLNIFSIKIIIYCLLSSSFKLNVLFLS